ncbi:hypothetical protein HYDPIDRAFT_112525 [Hydnomerulius pinastri MD-312]|uniref:Uncharacterized protein n=1 Tax=Hydnomerulius pinastri MD-312 TaxID=994086 RepID=A0A0C9W8U1_9AGAM|nr:hypothetical protein HYDPIDRAFT_112525 [Hydnomerulius pinastri MD-312]
MSSKPERHPELQSSISFFLQRLLGVAIFRSWRILTFFAAWATAVCLIDEKVHSLALQPTLLTVFGTVLGFVISFRTTTSYDRYNEGRKLWSQIVLASRTFARTVWFHVPEDATGEKFTNGEEGKVRTLIEKKAVINLLEGFAAATKHYLRGEAGINYNDIYPFVKFLPSYDALPRTIPGASICGGAEPEKQDGPSPGHAQRGSGYTESTLVGHRSQSGREGSGDSADSAPPATRVRSHNSLLPSELPPDRSFTAHCARFVCKMTGKVPDLKGKQDNFVHPDSVKNIPLEITFYLSSYIAALEARNDNIKPRIENPTISLLLQSLSDLVGALTGLERILTTPVIYSRHLAVLTAIYCLLLPFQILSTLGWFTIPATVLAAFMFFGFLVAGAEIENPFGYDKNDLDMQFFVHGIIRKELHAITSKPAPDPRVWAFSNLNDRLFPSCAGEKVEPKDWVGRGNDNLREALCDHAKHCHD